MGEPYYSCSSGSGLGWACLCSHNASQRIGNGSGFGVGDSILLRTLEKDAMHEVGVRVGLADRKGLESQLGFADQFGLAGASWRGYDTQ